MDVKRNCSSCKELVIRNQSPTDSWIYRFVDGKGSVWNGMKCPKCATFYKHLERRANAKYPSKFSIVKRYCRACRQQLDQRYYFYHPECRNNAWVTCEDTETYSVNFK